MKVKILRTDERLGVKAGEVYEAKRYKYAPTEKMELIGREGDGYNPQCNQYMSELAFWMQGKWMVLDGTKYVPEVA